MGSGRSQVTAGGCDPSPGTGLSQAWRWGHGQVLGTVAQWVLPKDKPSEAEGRLRKHESCELQTQTLPSPVLTPMLASGAKQERPPHSGLPGWAVPGHWPACPAVAGPTACPSPVPRCHAISCHLPPALTAPNHCSCCLNGVSWASACGSDSTGPLGLGGVPSYVPHVGAPPWVVGGGRMQNLMVLEDLKMSWL